MPRKRAICNSSAFATKGWRNSTKAEARGACHPGWSTSCASFYSPSKPRRHSVNSARFPGWKLHPLKGDLRGLWSLTVTGNWRLVFRYDQESNTASDIDLIDSH